MCTEQGAGKRERHIQRGREEESGQVCCGLLQAVMSSLSNLGCTVLWAMGHQLLIGCKASVAGLEEFPGTRDPG